jgi:hypothetical protein
VSAVFLEHHELRPSRGVPLVEVFRRAERIDVTGGVRRFGVTRGFVRALCDRWPSAGFHRRLVSPPCGYAAALWPLLMVRF